MSFDPAAARARHRAARAFSHTIGRFGFECLVPTGADYLRLRDYAISSGEFNYRMVLDHVTGWSGVRECDLAPVVVPGVDGETPVEFSRAALELFFEDHLAELSELVWTLDAKTTERGAALEAARKN